MPISLNEMYFIEQLSNLNIRTDQRDQFQYRTPLIIQNSSPKANFSAFVKLDRLSFEISLLELQEGSEMTHNINLNSLTKQYAAHLELLSAFLPENFVLSVRILTNGSGLLNSAVSALKSWNFDISFHSLAKVGNKWIADPTTQEEDAAKSIYLRVFNTKTSKIFAFGDDIDEIFKLGYQ